LFGGFQAGFFPVWARVTTDWIPVTERGSAQGTTWMSSRVGGALGPFLFFWLFGLTKGWTAPFWILGAVGVAWAVAFGLWFRNRPEDVPQVNAAERRLIERGQVVSTVESAGVPWSAFV